MGFDNKYPYTDFHEINLDWLLEKVKGIDDRFTAIEEAVDALREDLDIQTGRIDAALDAITFIQNHYPAMIASQYDESRQYDPGEIAIYDNELYIALPGETPGPWNGNYWNKTSLGDELGTIIIKVNDIILPDLTNINNVIAEYGTLFDDIVETYVPGSTYTKNQMVKYEDHIYRVMVASTNNPPTDTTDWDPETLANIVTDLLNFWNKIIPEYDETATYNVPDYVIYQGNIYTCNGVNVTGAWDGSKWNQVVLADDIASRLAFMYEMFSTLYGWFKSFDDVDTYNKGDVVNYNGTLYECLEDNVTGAWDASKWQVQKVTDAMTDINTYYKNFPIKILSGNPVNIADAIKGPIMKASATIPATGADRITIHRTGKNLVDWKWNTYSGSNKLVITLFAGTFVLSSKEEMGTGYIYVKGTKKDGTYCTQAELGLPASWAAASSPGVYYGGNNTTRRLDFSIPEDGVVFECGRANQDGTNPAQLEIGSTRTTFEEYNGNVYSEEFGTTISGGYYDFISGTGEDGSSNPITGTPISVSTIPGVNVLWTDGDDVEIGYHYSEQSVDYTPDDRVVVIGTYSGKRVLQINHFEQNVSLDGSLKSFNILPANAILINAWAYGKGNDDGTMANMNPWWSTTAGDLCIQSSSWASNTSADIWMYAQYVE